eukprot:g8854.t1
MAPHLFALFTKHIPGVVVYAKTEKIPESLKEIEEKGLDDGKLVVSQNAFNALQTEAIQQLVSGLEELEVRHIDGDSLTIGEADFEITNSHLQYGPPKEFKNIEVAGYVDCNTLITRHFQAYCDERLKENKKPVPDGVLPTLRKLQQYTYKWNDGTPDAGPMAPHLFALFTKHIPGVVVYAKTEKIPESLKEIEEKGLDDGKLVVSQNAFNALQTEAIQELASGLEKLEVQVQRNTETIATHDKRIKKLEMERLPESKNESPPWPREIESNDPFFTGNEELLQSLHDRMNTERAGKAICQDVLRGLGGTGKTAIVKQYARLYSEEYSGGVFWVSADTIDSIGDSFRGIASVDLKMEGLQKDTKIKEIIGFVLKWFQDNCNWLIIYDNADDLGSLKSFLPGKHAPGHILLTTRAKQDSNEFATLGFDAKKDIISISTLPQETAETLLLRVAGHNEDVEKQEKENANALKWLAGPDGLAGLPLALRQAGSFVRERRRSWAEYKTAYQKKHTTSFFIILSTMG